jgi:hypothetical protein
VNPKRIAGVINILAATAFLVIGLTRHPVRKFFLVIAALFFIIGYLRLRRTPPGPPSL